MSAHPSFSGRADADPRFDDDATVPHRTSHPGHRPALALYAAGLVLGVGVFNLPHQLTAVGLLPMIVLLAVMGAVTSRLIPRMITDSGRCDVFSAALVRNGGGRPGITLAFVGTAFHVLPATIAYATVGAAALEIVSDVVASWPMPADAALLLAVGSWWLSRQPRVPLPICNVAMLAVRWAVAIYIVSTFDLEGLVRRSVLLAAVAAGAITLMGAPAPSVRASSRRGGLAPAHARNVATLVTQLSLMALLAAVAVYNVWQRGTLVTPQLAVSPSFEGSVTTLGVALFAFTGTGFNNVASYPAMRPRRGGARIIAQSIGIVLTVQVGWLVSASLTVPDDRLVDFDASGVDTSAAVAAAVTGVGDVVSGLVRIGAALLVLFAVSAGSNGLSEALSREFSRSFAPAVSNLSVDSVLLQRCIVVAVAIGSLIITASEVPVNAVLAASGLAGSVVLVLAIPILAEPVVARRPRRSVTAVVVVTCVSGLGIGQAVTSGTGLIGIVVTAIPCAAVIAATLFAGEHAAMSAFSPDTCPPR